jgi:hypothetical protein
MLKEAETHPARKQAVLQAVTLNEALTILNPPTAIIQRIMQGTNMPRHEAEAFLQNVKDGKTDPHRPAGIPPLSPELIRMLERYVPKGDEEDIEPPEPDITRVNFCLEAILRLAGQLAPLPRRLGIAREDTEDSAVVYLTVGMDEQVTVDMSAEVARALCVPKDQASELNFRIFDPKAPEVGLIYFSGKSCRLVRAVQGTLATRWGGLLG